MKNNKEQKILGRLNKDLENGDLREYLINKNEYKEKPVFLIYLLSLIFFIMYFIIFNISL